MKKRLSKFVWLILLGATPAIGQNALLDPDPFIIQPVLEPVEPDPRDLVPTTVDGIGRIWVPVLINSQGPFRMTLDTGADSSAVLQSVADKLGLPYVENGLVQLHGVTGSTVVQTIKIESMSVGKFTIENLKVPVVNDAFGGADGILGVRGWEDMRIFLDFKRDQFRIAPSLGERIPSGFRKVPIKFTDNMLISMDLRIGNIITKAIFDSGAQKTMGNSKLREALFQTSSTNADQEIVGISLDVSKGQSIKVPTVHFGGGVYVDNLSVAFGDMFIFDAWKLNAQPAIIVGMDLIGIFEAIIIDYKKEELSLRLRQ